MRAFFLALMLLLPSFALGGPNTLAVLYFENQGNPDLEPLKVGLAQMLITDLTGTGDFEVVEREQLQAILDEQKLGHEGFTDPGTAAKIGKLLGAQKMLMGGYFKMGAVFRVDARLVDVETSKILASHGVNGSVQEFLQIEAELAEFTRNTLAGQPTPRPTRSKPAPAPTPAPPEPTPADPTPAPALANAAKGSLHVSLLPSAGLVEVAGHGRWPTPGQKKLPPGDHRVSLLNKDEGLLGTAVVRVRSGVKSSCSWELTESGDFLFRPPPPGLGTCELVE